MRLTKEHKKILLDLGVQEEDFDQIEQATKVTTYYELKDKKIGIKKAIELLGIREYLSGISRSAFHFTACRYTKHGQCIYFDSSRLFKE